MTPEKNSTGCQRKCLYIAPESQSLRNPSLKKLIHVATCRHETDNLIRSIQLHEDLKMNEKPSQLTICMENYAFHNFSL